MEQLIQEVKEMKEKWVGSSQERRENLIKLIGTVVELCAWKDDIQLYYQEENDNYGYMSYRYVVSEQKFYKTKYCSGFDMGGDNYEYYITVKNLPEILSTLQKGLEKRKEDFTAGFTADEKLQAIINFLQ